MDEQEISGGLRLLAADRPDLGAVLRGIRHREAARSKRRAHLAMAAAAGSVVVIVGGVGVIGRGSPDEPFRIPPGSGGPGDVPTSIAATTWTAAPSAMVSEASPTASEAASTATEGTIVVSSSAGVADSTGTLSSSSAFTATSAAGSSAGSSIGTVSGGTP